jgi:hypothetical protein
MMNTAVGYGSPEVLETIQDELERLVQQRLNGPFTTEQTRRYAELTQLEERLLQRSA